MRSFRSPENIFLSREPRLSGLFETPSKSTKLRKYIEKNWRFNLTKMDPDWYDDLQRRNPSEDFDWSNDPFHAVFQFEAFHRGKNLRACSTTWLHYSKTQQMHSRSRREASMLKSSVGGFQNFRMAPIWHFTHQNSTIREVPYRV